MDKIQCPVEKYGKALVMKVLEDKSHPKHDEVMEHYKKYNRYRESLMIEPY